MIPADPHRPATAAPITPEACALGVRALGLVEAGGHRPFSLVDAALSAKDREQLEPWRDPAGSAPLWRIPVQAFEPSASLSPALRAELFRAAAAHDAAPGPVQMMGIINVTPDSFSDGGLYLDPERAIARGRELLAQGAHWLDIGGESTRPGALPVDPATQIERVVPVIAGLAGQAGLRISVDTTRASVARAALEAGATMVNDVSGGLDDPDLLPVAAQHGCELVLMHRQGDSENMQVAPSYGDVVADVYQGLLLRARRAMEAGVAPDRIWLDPGIGFGKRVEHNLGLLRRLPELRSSGFPLLLGVSRKSFIAHITGAEKAQDWQRARQAREDHPQDHPQHRLGGTAAALMACIQGGAQLLRVHDVEIMSEAAAVGAALWGRELAPSGKGTSQ